MAAIAWSERLSLGVPEVDRQHRKLIDLCACLEGAMSGAPMSPDIRRVLSDLRSYARYHFTAEENRMRSRAWTGLEAHATLHQEFCGKLDSLEALFLRVGPQAAAVAGSRFLRTWIVRHIAVADRLAWTSMQRQE